MLFRAVAETSSATDVCQRATLVKSPADLCIRRRQIRSKYMHRPAFVPWLLTILVAFTFTIGPTAVWAQDYIEPPAPQQQPGFNPPPRTPSPYSNYNPTEELPQQQPPATPMPPPPMPQPYNPGPQYIPIPVPVPVPMYTPPPPPPSFNPSQTAPQLPEVFRGCWEGTVEYLDSNRPVPGGHKVGYWTPKTYRLCYKRVGDGPYQLTFGETAVVASEKIKYSRGRVDVLSTDGRSFARLRAFLHFDEYYPHERRGSTFAVDEVTNLDCSISANQMTVRATVKGRREDEPWFDATWHTTFIHVPQ
jgi:hypothetical protein